MTITANKFRSDFTEFSNATIYPNSSINFWLNFSSLFMNQARWGAPQSIAGAPNTTYDVGQELFVAHNLVLEAKANAEAAVGAPPGITTGPVSQESVDKVAASYDVQAGIEPDAGHWNLTIYGTRFVKLEKMMGAGGIQLGVGYDPTGGLGSANAWGGIYVYDVPTPNG